jgi:hypothetical protein
MAMPSISLIDIFPPPMDEPMMLQVDFLPCNTIFTLLDDDP